MVLSNDFRSNATCSVIAALRMPYPVWRPRWCAGRWPLALLHDWLTAELPLTSRGDLTNDYRPRPAAVLADGQRVRARLPLVFRRRLADPLVGQPSALHPRVSGRAGSHLPAAGADHAEKPQQRPQRLQSGPTDEVSLGSARPPSQSRGGCSIMFCSVVYRYLEKIGISDNA